MHLHLLYKYTAHAGMNVMVFNCDDNGQTQWYADTSLITNFYYKFNLISAAIWTPTRIAITAFHQNYQCTQKNT